MLNNSIYLKYKPFRNQIRQFEKKDSLYVIWAFSRNYTFNFPFPIDIELPNNFNQRGDLSLRRYYGLPDFELDFLMKEFILNCENHKTRKTLKEKAKLGKIVNYLRKTLINEIETQIHNQHETLLEFHRLIHLQFKWQIGYSTRSLFRYYKIFSNKELCEIVEERMGLKVFDLYIIGLFLFRLTSEVYLNDYPLTSEFPYISEKKLSVFFKLFSINVDEAKDKLKQFQNINEDLYYTLNPIHETPILIIKDKFFCPIPVLIFWQITSGIYYYIYQDSKFSNSFGESFERYIGELLKKTCSNSELKIIPESKYGKEEKLTTDWILMESKAILFIECKTKRLTYSSKSDLEIKNGLEKDLRKMADFIFQVYKTYLDYSAGLYQTLSYEQDKKFIPLVLTLESWYINLNPFIMEILHNFVLEKFSEKKIDSSVVSNFPYHIRSCHEFENDIQVINKIGIKEYFQKITDNSIFEFQEKFKFSDPFDDEFDEIFIHPIREKGKL